MKRKLIALILTLCLALSMASMALASEGGESSGDTSSSTPEEPAAEEINSLETLTAALAKNASVTLTGNVSVESTAELDLSDKTVETAGKSFIVKNGAKLTVTGGTVNNNSAGTLGTDARQLFTVEDGGELVIKGTALKTVAFEPLRIIGSCAFESGSIAFTGEDCSAYDGAAMVTVEKGAFTMQSGSISTGTGKTASDGMYGIYALDGATVNLGDETTHNGPTVTSHFAPLGQNALHAPATWNIYGGTYEIKTNTESDWWKYFCGAIYASGASTMNISGGTFKGTSYGICFPYANTETVVNISGGDFSSTGTNFYFRDTTANNVPENTKGTPKLTITGGKFSSDPREYVPSTHIAAEDENTKKWAVTEKAGLEVVATESPDPTTGAVSTEIGGVYKPNNSADASNDDVDNSGNAVTFTIPEAAGGTEVKSVTATIGAETAASFNGESVTIVPTVTVATQVGSVELPQTAVEKIAEAGSEGNEIVLTVEKKDNVATGDTGATTVQAFDVSLVAKDAEGNETPVLPEGSSNGAIELTLPVENPQANGHVYYGIINSSSKFVALEKKLFDVVDGGIKLSTGHLSVYAYSATELDTATATLTANGTTTSYTDFADLVTALSSASSPVTITLYDDVTLSSTLTIPSGKDVTFIGNGNTISAADSFSDRNLIVAGANTVLALNNVKINANQKCRAIVANGDPGAQLTLNDTIVTGGLQTDTDCAGVMVTSKAKLTVTGNSKIDGNQGKIYDDDALKYSHYADDLWVGNDAEVILQGGEVGKVFVNANGWADSTDGGNLNVSGAIVDAVFVEAQNNTTGNVVVVNDGEIKELLVAMDYTESGTDSDLNRVVVEVTPNDGNTVTVEGGFIIPANTTAKVVRVDGDTRTADQVMRHSITISQDATLVIPEGVTVTMTTPSDGGEPTITNNGTLDVQGNLIAGTDTTTDGKYVNIAGSGEILGIGNIDLDSTTKAQVATVNLTLDYNDGTRSPVTITKSVIVTGAPQTITFKLDTPVRSSYNFDGWNGSYGDSYSINVTAGDKLDITLTAQWTFTGTVPPPYRPGTSTPAPTTEPTTAPSAEPTQAPSTEPTTEPTGEPTTEPTSEPTTQPTTEPSADFKDMSKASSDEAREAIRKAVAMGILQGYGDNTFRPRNGITRWEFAVVMARADLVKRGNVGTPAELNAILLKQYPNGCKFTDVMGNQNLNDIVRAGVAYCADHGIMDGRGSAIFDPNTRITRQEAALTLAKWAKLDMSNTDLSAFSDGNDVSSWAAGGVKAACDAGLMKGTSATSLSPKANLQREQAAILLVRYFESTQG